MPLLQDGLAVKPPGSVPTAAQDQQLSSAPLDCTLAWPRSCTGQSGAHCRSYSDMQADASVRV